jgi:hypothetical protein
LNPNSIDVERDWHDNQEVKRVVIIYVLRITFNFLSMNTSTTVLRMVVQHLVYFGVQRHNDVQTIACNKTVVAFLNVQFVVLFISSSFLSCERLNLENLFDTVQMTDFHTSFAEYLFI